MSRRNLSPMLIILLGAILMLGAVFASCMEAAVADPDETSASPQLTASVASSAYAWANPNNQEEFDAGWMFLKRPQLLYDVPALLMYPGQVRGINGVILQFNAYRDPLSLPDSSVYYFLVQIGDSFYSLDRPLYCRDAYVVIADLSQDARTSTDVDVFLVVESGSPGAPFATTYALSPYNGSATSVYGAPSAIEPGFLHIEIHLGVLGNRIASMKYAYIWGEFLQSRINWIFNNEGKPQYLTARLEFNAYLMTADGSGYERTVIHRGERILPTSTDRISRIYFMTENGQIGYMDNYSMERFEIDGKPETEVFPDIAYFTPLIIS